MMPPRAKSWLIGKDSDVGRDWGQEETGTTEDEMAGWHHWLDGRESQWTPGVGNEQGGLACCNLWGRKELDMTERLIWSDLICILNISLIILIDIILIFNLLHVVFYIKYIFEIINQMNTTKMHNYSLRFMGSFLWSKIPWWLSGKESACQCRRHQFDC